MIMFLIGAFFGGKLLRTKIWQQRCLLAFSFSSFVISMIVIWQKISELSQTIDKGSFMIFERGEIPLFDGSVTMLSSFLMISLILTFGMMYSAKGSKQKTVLLLNSILLVGALALLQCIPVGFCGSIALISFFFIMSDKTLPVLLIGSAVTASGTLLIPVTVKKELASTILSLDSLGVYSIINIWDSSLELLKASSFMGVGIGGFSKLYPIYALAGTENVSNCGSLWIRLIGELGIIGIVVFMIILFLYAQNCSEYLRKPLNRASKACVAAGLSCVVLLCIVALIYDIFRNNCMFYIFWMMISVVSAKIKCDRGEIEKNTGYSINSEYAASVNL